MVLLQSSAAGDGRRFHCEGHRTTSTRLTFLGHSPPAAGRRFWPPWRHGSLGHAVRLRPEVRYSAAVQRAEAEGQSSRSRTAAVVAAEAAVGLWSNRNCRTTKTKTGSATSIPGAPAADVLLQPQRSLLLYHQSVLPQWGCLNFVCLIVEQD